MTNSTTMESHPEIIDRKRQGQPFLAAEEERLRVEVRERREEKKGKEKKEDSTRRSPPRLEKDFVLVIKKKSSTDAQSNGR